MDTFYTKLRLYDDINDFYLSIREPQIQNNAEKPRAESPIS